MFRWFSLFWAASALFAISCGGGADEPLLSLTDVAPELVGLDGARLHSQPASAEFGPDGGTLELADGARLEIPEGAFEEPANLTVAIIELETDERIEQGRVYAVSADLLQSDEEVGELPLPIALILPWADRDIALAEFKAGEWALTGITGDAPAVVPIDHFSTVYVGAVTCAQIFLDPFADNDGVAPESAKLAAQICLWAFEDAQQKGEDRWAEDRSWVLGITDAAIEDLTAAGVARKDVSQASGELGSCLFDRLAAGFGQDTALSDCRPIVEDYFPESTPTVESATQLPEPTAGPVTRVFRGTGTMAVSDFIDCHIDVDFELRLNPDQSATLLLSGTVSTFKVSQDPQRWECRTGDAQLYQASWAESADGLIAETSFGSSGETFSVEFSPPDVVPATARVNFDVFLKPTTYSLEFELVEVSE